MKLDILKHSDRYRLSIAWDVLMAVLATYTAVEIPLEHVVGFTPRAWVFFSNKLVTVCFIVDVFVRLRQQRKATGREVSRMKRWLIVDFVAAVPSELLLMFPGAGPMRLLSLTKMVKVFRVASYGRIWLKPENASPVFTRLSSFAYFLTICIHWISCGWLALHYSNDPAVYGNMLNAYLRSLYWSFTTITTIGYGDVTPTLSKNAELLFTMFVQILGVGTYGYIIGNVANLLTNIDMAEARHKERVERMTRFMKSKKIPVHLQKQVHQYFDYLWDTRRGYDDATVLSELPESFRFEFALLLNKGIIEKVPLFKGADAALVREIVFRLRPAIFIPGDIICAYGEIGERMYFINNGSVEVTSPDGKHVYATLKEGQFFGEIALLLKQPRNATIRAVDYCDLYSLDKESFDGVLSNYPDFERHIKAMAQDRLNASAGQ